MANVIVAVACNLVAVLLLVSGIISAVSNGTKVTLIKMIMVIGGGVGAYFLTPVISNKVYKINGMETVLSEFGVSKASVNSCLFLLWFLLFYAITLITCSIVRHCMIKKLRNKKLNKLKMKRAKSINPQAEKATERAEWKALKLKYKEKLRWYHRLVSGFLGAILAVVVGYIVIMPYGYIASDINAKHDKNYLTDGYKYTLNGLIGEDASDFLIHCKENKEDVPDGDDEVEDESTDETSNSSNVAEEGQSSMEE